MSSSLDSLEGESRVYEASTRRHNLEAQLYLAPWPLNGRFSRPREKNTPSAPPFDIYRRISNSTAYDS